MSGPYLFSSERLGFRNWYPSDVEAMSAINSDPEVMAFFPTVQDREQTTRFIQRMQNLYAERGFCYFAVETLAAKEFIGFTGLAWQEYAAPFTPCVDIGWRLKTASWGRGYATEGAKRCLEYAFYTLCLDRVIATAPRVNLRSVKVMQQAGMRPLTSFQHPALSGYPLLVDCVAYVAERDSGRQATDYYGMNEMP